MNAESQELYQRELVQHGKTMEELTAIKLEVGERIAALLSAQSEAEKMKVELKALTVSAA